MKDSHIHIGQFYENYYDPLEVMDSIVSAGVDSCWYSSTISSKENVNYNEIEKEIELVTAHYSPEKFKPFLWYVPEYAKQGISPTKALSMQQYGGIKIHPRANNWDMNEYSSINILSELFQLASELAIPVLIHTGYDAIDEANKCNSFFEQYQKVKIILAHCRPIAQTLGLLKKYQNVYCDTAFLPMHDLLKIIQYGFSKRIFCGSDFPITHYFKQNDSEKTIPLAEQYDMDKNVLEKYKILIGKDCSEDYYG
jgi:predicted TIM-barrel fold metal-dependent hydrolase